MGKNALKTLQESKKMDDSEKMVLRRRKQHLSEILDMNDELLSQLQTNGLLSEESVNLALLEKVNQTRVLRVIDQLISSRRDDAFMTLCNVLSAEYKWLSRDLIVDLKIERGDVQPDPQTVEESAVLVHRKFGTSKRFSETDKKEMSEMIAIKLQIARDEWSKETRRLEDMLKDERAINQARHEVAMTVSKIQKEFVRRHESQLVTHSHDMITTRELIQRILSDSPNGTDVLFRFKENQEMFLKQMALALYHRESLHHEKLKCLKMLGVTGDPKVALDEVISKATGLTINGDLQTENKDDIIRKLKRQVEEMEKQNTVHLQNVKEFRRQLGDRDREISKLRQMIHIK